MARTVKPLNDKQLKNAKLKDKNYTLPDGNGLHLLVKTTGVKLWEFIYKSPITHKRRKTSFGNYPQIILSTARDKKNEYLNLVRKGIDPLEEKQNKKIEIQKTNEEQKNTFKKVATQWLLSYESEVSENYHHKLTRALELYVYPFIQDKPITDIKRLDLIAILQDLKDRDLKETANRTFMLLNKVFMYATMLELTPHNITADIDKKVILGKIVKKNYPTLTKLDDIKGLLLAIDEYGGDYTTKKALQMLPYVFVRSFNIRLCEWYEIDFKNKLWIIPPNKMKVKKEFTLPLPHQVITILEEIKEFSGSGRYVFPSFRGNDKPMSDNTMISALRRMGYTKDELVPHSFRSIFSTISYENMNVSIEDGGHKLKGEVIESLLAHEEQNKVKGAYNRAEYLDAKKELMQWYGDYLDEVKNEFR
ncbi:MAG: integrase arm-type DNA-binding domain-containing protein [Arcobacteraceae bacterium]|nr:integrase arm-type DNA-binding domain-containing protein [Arcobacteraceae bacterium]